MAHQSCLFGHSAGEVAAALLVGSEAPRSDVREFAAEVQGLRRVVQKLAGTIMWDRANPAATAVAKSVVEAWPLGIAQFSASTESEITVSSGEAGLSWPGERETRPTPKLVKLGLLGSPSAVSLMRHRNPMDHHLRV